MNHRTTTTAHGLAAFALLGLLAATAACGTETGVSTEPAVQAPPGMQHGRHDLGPSDRALRADAARAAQGQLPGTPTPAPSARRVTDVLP